MARTDGKKRGAAPRTGGSSNPRWPLFAGGIVTGLLVAGAVWLAGILPTAMELRERILAHEADCGDTPATADKPAANTDGKPASDKPLRFDFYTLLPQQEVVAPVNGGKTTTATPVPAPTTAPTTAPTATPATVAGERFLLQAGSFRTRAEADRRRAELLLSGHSVNVQDVTTANNEQWFRVMVGPFDDDTAMQKARQQLAASKIDTLPIRLR